MSLNGVGHYEMFRHGAAMGMLEQQVLKYSNLAGSKGTEMVLAAIAGADPDQFDKVRDFKIICLKKYEICNWFAIIMALFCIYFRISNQNLSLYLYNNSYERIRQKKKWISSDRTSTLALLHTKFLV